MIEKVCQYCGEKFKVSNYRVNAKFCCRECYGKSLSGTYIKKKLVTKTCKQCDKKYQVWNYRKQTSQFCSKKCYWLYMKNKPQKNANDIQRKIYNTMKKNNTFIGKGSIQNNHCSLDEQQIYEKLLTKFHNIQFEPFIDGYGKADFYIPELDLYIEYQGNWTHNPSKTKVMAPYDKNNKQHQKILQELKNKTNNNPKSYYANVIKVWTISDVKKRKFVKENKLNWMEFFNINEFNKWFDTLK